MTVKIDTLTEVALLVETEIGKFEALSANYKDRKDTAIATCNLLLARMRDHFGLDMDTAERKARSMARKV